MSKKGPPVHVEHVEDVASEDNRGRVRHQCRLGSFHRSHRCGCDTGILADIRDISATGIGLTVRRRFEPGSLLFVELVCSFDASTHLIPVTVIHASELDNGHWLLGCNFPRALSQTELADLVLDKPVGRIFT